MNKVIFIIIPIFAVILGIVLNFQEFSMGSPATVKNLIVTLAYITIWIFLLISSAKSQNRILIKCYSAFWLLTLFISILTCFVNITGGTVDWAIPFVVLLLTQWYGIDLLVDNFLITSVIILVLSLVMFVATIVSLRRTKME